MPGVGEESDVVMTAAKPTSTTSIANKGSSENIERLYLIYERLNNAENKVTLERDFRDLLSAVKGTDKEKRLASQFITRFMEFFPLLYGDAIDALLDLCEDDDVAIRKQVEKDMIGVCKKITTFVPKVADVYAQLMQTADVQELSTIQNSLISLFHIDAKATIVGLFSQIEGGEEVVRLRCLKFLSGHLKDLSPEIATPAFESTLLTCVKKVLGEMSCEDFKTLLQMLMETKLLKTVSGQQAVVDMIADQLNFSRDADITNPDVLDRLLVYCKHVQPLFSSQVSSTPYLVYFCRKIVSKLRETGVFDENNEVTIDILKMMAELASNVNQIDEKLAMECISIAHSALLEVLPLPPDEDDESTPKYDFNCIECHLYVLHKLGPHASEFLSEPDRLKDLRQRLQYFARSSQAYMKKLKEDFTQVQAASDADLKNDDNRVKLIAYKMIANINAIIKDLFHTPPVYKSVIRLSWRPIQKNSPVQLSPLKRKAAVPIRGPSSTKMNRGTDRERVLYQPPSGKFSKHSGPFTSPPSNRGRMGRFQGGGQSRGGYRGGLGRNGRRPFRGRQ